MSKGNPRRQKGTTTWPPEGVKLEVWSYRVGGQRECHVCFVKNRRTYAQGRFRIKEPRP